jgi:hypothetical protein
MADIGPTKNLRYKRTLKYFISLLLSSIVFVSLTIILSDAHDRHLITMILLNATAAVATCLGIIAVYRHKLVGSHGKSYLFLAVGITLWFCADFILFYLYLIEGITEQKQFSLSDVFWLGGYVFLSLHLISVIRTICIKNVSKTISILLVFVMIFIITNLIQSTSYSVFSNSADRDRIMGEYGIINLIITIVYPILDLSLIIPSIIILVNLYHEYQHSIPWVLSSLSLLTNAIADNGFVNDFVRGAPSSWIWDLLYVNDFIIMAAALYWFNKFHISEALQITNDKKGF